MIFPVVRSNRLSLHNHQNLNADRAPRHLVHDVGKGQEIDDRPFQDGVGIPLVRNYLIARPADEFASQCARHQVGQPIASGDVAKGGNRDRFDVRGEKIGVSRNVISTTAEDTAAAHRSKRAITNALPAASRAPHPSRYRPEAGNCRAQPTSIRLADDSDRTRTLRRSNRADPRLPRLSEHRTRPNGLRYARMRAPLSSSANCGLCSISTQNETL